MPMIPHPSLTRTNPTENTYAGDITPSNKSPQTPQAKAQNMPQGRAEGSGARVISSKGPTRTNGKMGRASFR